MKKIYFNLNLTFIFLGIFSQNLNLQAKALPKYAMASKLKIRVQHAILQFDSIDGRDAYQPNQDLEPIVEDLKDFLNHKLQSGSMPPSLKEITTQTLNTLMQVSAEVESVDETYPHKIVVNGKYPTRPTVEALKSMVKFFNIYLSNDKSKFKHFASSDEPARIQLALQNQMELVSRIVEDPISYYEQAIQQIRINKNTPFADFEDIIVYLELSIKSLEMGSYQHDKYLTKYREIVLEELQAIKAAHFPYLESIRAMGSSLKFLDVVERVLANYSRSEKTSLDGNHMVAPALYHSLRYEYYYHFLEEDLDQHLMLPTIAELSTMDLLKVRSTPIGFLGVSAQPLYVDGSNQTSYEFFIHDINHSRQMYQFAKEDAEAMGITLLEYAKQAHAFMSYRVFPLIDTDWFQGEELAKRQLKKIILFEVVHENALAPNPKVIVREILRKNGETFAFEERSSTNGIQYVMYKGATTLAYVYRKLAHDFFDLSEDRNEDIVLSEYRTQDMVALAAYEFINDLCPELNITMNDTLALATNDQGFPEPFLKSLLDDISHRSSAPGESTSSFKELEL